MTVKPAGAHMCIGRASYVCNIIAKLLRNDLPDKLAKNIKVAAFSQKAAT